MSMARSIIPSWLFAVCDPTLRVCILNLLTDFHIGCREYVQIHVAILNTLKIQEDVRGL